MAHIVDSTPSSSAGAAQLFAAAAALEDGKEDATDYSSINRYRRTTLFVINEDITNLQLIMFTVPVLYICPVILLPRPQTFLICQSSSLKKKLVIHVLS
jgi:hypothetical protein